MAPGSSRPSTASRMPFSNSVRSRNDLGLQADLALERGQVLFDFGDLVIDAVRARRKYRLSLQALLDGGRGREAGQHRDHDDARFAAGDGQGEAVVAGDQQVGLVVVDGVETTARSNRRRSRGRPGRWRRRCGSARLRPRPGGPSLCARARSGRNRWRRSVRRTAPGRDRKWTVPSCEQVEGAVGESSADAFGGRGDGGILRVAIGHCLQSSGLSVRGGD